MDYAQIEELLKKRPEGRPGPDIRVHLNNVQDHFLSLIKDLSSDDLKCVGAELAERIEYDNTFRQKRYPLSAMKFEILRQEHRRRFPAMYDPPDYEDCSCDDCS